MLVAPDCKLYHINSEADAAALYNLRSDVPRLDNLKQLLGWAAAPRGKAPVQRDGWQLFEKVAWVENAVSSEVIPLVGTAASKLITFNAQAGTSYLLDASFRKFLSGERPFNVWSKLDKPPAEAALVAHGGSLFDLRARPRPRSREAARMAIAALSPTPMMPVGSGACAGGLAVRHHGRPAGAGEEGPPGPRPHEKSPAQKRKWRRRGAFCAMLLVLARRRVPCCRALRTTASAYVIARCSPTLCAHRAPRAWSHAKTRLCFSKGRPRAAIFPECALFAPAG